MRFFRQTLLSVCLILPCVVFGQPIANDDTASTPEDTNAVFNVVSNDTDPTSTIDPNTVDLDISTPLINDNTFTTPEGEFNVDPLGEVTFIPAPDFYGNATLSYTVQNTEATPQTSAPALITVTVTAVNDAPVFTKGPDQTVTENAGAQTVNNWATGIDDGDPQLTQALTFNVINDNNALFSVQPSISSSGTLTYTPAANTIGSATVDVTLSDDGIGPGVNTSAQQTFLISVISINNAPVFTNGPDQNVSEDAVAQTIAGWATGIDDANPENQALTFNVIAVNTALFSVQPSISASGTLTYTPAVNANGTTVVDVTLSDDGLSSPPPNVNTSAQQTFNITINALNDAPVFTKGPDQTVGENAGAQTVNNWATGIDDGDPELTQALTFNVSNDNNALFSVQPSISPIGNLTYTPAANTVGSATIDVTLSDDGIGPGVNTSAQQTFIISVTAINNAPIFTKGPDQTIDEDAGAQTIAGWATGIDDGDADEVQILTFNVSAVNSALFSVQPSINASGQLTYTPATNANGTTVVNVTLSDNGPGAPPPNVNTSAQQTFNITIDAINDAPVFAKGLDQTVGEDAGPQTVAAWATGIDDGDPGAGEVQALTFNVVAVNSALFSAQPSINASGTLTYTPAANANGTTVVNVTLSDDGPGAPPPNVNTSAQQTFNITINAINDAPVFTKGPDQNVNENAGAQTINNWATGIDDGDPGATEVQALTFNVNNDNNALFSVQPSISPSGTLTYTPAVNTSGSATVDVTLSDDGVGPGVNTSAPQTFLISVSSTNSAPVFTKGPDQTIGEDAGAQTIVGWATGIDDGDADQVQALTFNVTAVNSALFSVQPAINASGQLTYTPAANANGTTVVNVTLSDDGPGAPPPNVNISAQQTFNITINAINDAPVFTKGPDQNVSENAGAQTINNWATGINDGDPGASEVQALTFNVNNDNNALFSAQPSITPTGNLTYTPALNMSGSATVSVTLSDDGIGPGVNTSAPQTFLISVSSTNSAPVFTKGPDQTIGEDAGAQTVAAWATGIDDGDADEVQALTFNVSAVNSALFSVQPAINASGQLTYTPAANANGASVVNVTLSDDGPGAPPPNVNTSAQQSFNITINAINDAPVFTKGPDQNVSENAGAQTINNWATGIDDGDPGATEVQALTFNVNNDNNALFSVQPSISPSGTLTYTPAVNTSGSATVDVTLSDDGVGPGVNTSAPQTFLISVSSTNSAPVFTKGPDQTIGEDAGAQTIVGWATGIDDGDADQVQALTFNVTAVNSALFSVQPAINASGQLTYTPAANANGTTVVNVTLSDDGPGAPPPNVNISAQQTFNITINAINDAPVFTKGPDQNVSENAGAQTINNWATGINDGDPGASEVQALTFNVNNDNNALFSAQPSITPTGNLTYTPALNMSGSATVSVTLSDDGIGPGVNTSAPQTFLISVSSTNSAPVFTKGPDQTIGEDAGAQTVAAWATGIDDGDADEVQALTFNVSAVNSALFSVQPAINASGQLTYTPAANANGATVVNVTLSDDGPGAPPPNVNTSAQQTFNITINAINDAPVFTKGPDQNVGENAGAQTINNWATAISDGDPGASEVQVLTFNVNNDNNALFSVQPSISPSGTLTYTPAANTSGSATVDVTLSDDGIGPGVNTSAPQTFLISVNSTNSAPVFTKGPDQTIGEDAGPQTVAAWATGIDDGDADEVQALTFNVSAVNSALFSIQPAINASGQLTYTPAANANGTTVVNVTLSDDGPGAPPPNVNTSAQQTFNITINAINDSPEFTKGPDQTIGEDAGPQTIAGWATGISDGDPELTQALTFNVNAVNSALFSAQPSINASGQLTYTAAADANGTSVITVTLSDNGLGAPPNVNVSAQQNFNITINAINDAPIFTKGPDQTVTENAGAQTIVGWATGISDGDPEATQALTFDVNNNNNALFSVQPAISPSGILTYTPANDIGGSAVVNVTLSDDGVGPGVNTSAPQSFTITVNANNPPTITSIADQTINEDAQTGPLSFTIGDVETPATSLILIPVSSNTGLVPNANIILGGMGSLRNVNVIPTINQNGITTITLTVSDGAKTAQTAFQVMVTALDDPPTISSIADQTIDEDTQTGLLPFTVGDVDTGPGSLVVTGSSDNTVLVPDANIALVGAGGADWTVQVTPVLNQYGEANITLTVSDGVETADITFKVTVTNVNDAPTISAVADQTVPEDTPTGALPFTVDDLETAAGSLVVTGVSSNTTLVPLANVVLGGSGANRTVTVTPALNQIGVTTITLTVSDGTTTTDTDFTVTVGADDDPPVITAIGDQTINEDSPGTGALSFTIGDPETPATSLTLTGGSDDLTLVPLANIVFGGGGANRTVTVTPAANQNGTATITVNVSDGVNITPETFLLTVNALNDDPTITDIVDQVIDEDNPGGTGLLDFTVGDLETAAGSLTVTRTTSNPALVPLGNVVLGGSGANRTVSVTPLLNQSGSTTITLTVSDGTATAQIDFLVTVNAVNDAPTITAIADQTIDENTPTGPLSFTVGDVETAVGSLIVTTASSNTTLVPVANVVLGGSGASRNVNVTPALNENGVAIITVTVDDGTSTTDINFQVTVSSIDDSPTITAIADQVIDEDTPTGALGFTVGDTETPPGSLTLSGSSSNAALVPDLNITFGGSGAARTVTVTPAPNQSGAALITVNVSDGMNTTPETFQVTVNAVNDAPTITVVADQVIDEDTPGGTGLLAFTVGDPETPGSLTVTRTSSNPALAPLANVVLGGSGANRTVTVTPLANQSGSTTITLTVSDGAATAEIDFLVTVNAVNDDPTITVIADQTVDENTSTGPLPFTVGDVETAPGSVTVTGSSSNTTLVPLANIVLGGSGASRTVNVTPATNESGVTTITITVDDGTSTAQTSFDVTVNSVDDAPTITAIADQVIDEDTQTGALSFTIGDLETGPGSLTVAGSSSNTPLVPNVNITFGGSGASRTVTINPSPNQSGVTMITVNISDGVNTTPETFQLTVNAVNDAPTITAIADQTINEDTPTGDLVFTVADVETAASALTVTASSSNTTLVPNTNITLGGTGPSRTINVTPVSNLSGVTTITVNVSDGLITIPRTFQVTVNALNDAPTITAIADQTIVEDTPTGALAFTIGDEETPVGSLTVTRSSTNTVLVPIANIVLGGSGASQTVTVTPAGNQTGVTTITLSVDDGTATTSTDFVVTVTAIDDVPTITAITDRTINEDSQTGIIPFTIGDPETAASALVVTGSSSNTTLVPDANIALAGTGASRTVNVIPAANESGTATITLNVSDGVNTVPTTFQVTVNAVNDVPLITNQVLIAIDEFQPLVLSVSQLTIQDPDNIYPTDFTLIVTGGSDYTIIGPTTIRPNLNYSGVLTVPVLVTDGTALSAIYNLQVTVNSTNNIPVITGQTALSINEDQTLAIQFNNLTVDDPDDVYPDDFTLTVLPGGPNYTFSGTTVTPAANFNGTLIVVVKVNDGSADSAPFNLQITVTPVNDAPAITAQSPLSTNEETSITLVIGNFTVTDLEPTTYTLTVSSAPATDYTVSGNTVTPNVNFNGTLSVPVTVSDGTANSAPYAAQIQVLPVNDPPVITGQISLSTVEDIPITLQLTDLTVNDIDNPGYPTGFTLSVQNGDDYTFSGTTITPDLDFVGQISVNVTVNDGTTSSVPFPVQIEVTDDADAPVITGQNPVSLNEDASREIVMDDLIVDDPDTPVEQRTLIVLPGTNYSLTGNTITPLANFYGTLTVNVRVNDGEVNSNTFPLQVTVTPINDLPSFNAIANITILEDAAQQSFVITGISPGPLETQPLSLSVVSDNTALIPQPTQTPMYNGTAASATISFKPQPNMFGTATITVKVLDADLLEATKIFTITVISVNDAPTLAAITVDPIFEDSPEQIIPLTGITSGGGAGESTQVLTIILSSDPSDLFEIFEQVYTSPQSTGSLRIKPKANAFGTVQITVRVQDDGPATPAPNVNFVNRTFTLIIEPINDPTIFISQPITSAEPGKLYEYFVEVTDVDGEDITLTAPDIPEWLTFTLGTNGKATLSGIPPADASGDVNISLTATDPTGPPAMQGYTLIVNSRPILSPVTITIYEDVAHTFDASEFTAGFEDPDGNPLAELQITELPTKGVLRLNNNPVAAGDKIPAAEISALTYTPLQDSTGTDTLHWSASDGYFLYSLVATYAVLNVLPTNDAPIIRVLETDTLKYELGSETPVSLTTTFDGYDPDGDNITGAEVGFKRIDNYQYREDHDVLIFEGHPKISGTFNDAAGILSLTGTATAAEYVEAIRSIKYNYEDARELLLDSRSVYIRLSDGQIESQEKARIITLIYTFSDLNIPTAFTPNGDPENETWRISSANGTDQYNDAEIKVYNKRGLLLFETKGFENSWNGIWNGEILPSDTYFYTIDLNYNKVRYKGTVTILR